VNPEARFERLYRAHADRVHAYARRRSSVTTADEVVADVFLVAWRRLDQVPEEPLPWLLGVARRVLANRRRADGRAAALRDRLAGLPRLSEPVHEAVDGRVAGALARLGERDRELLLLIAWEGLDQAEVAEAMGLRRATVAMRLHRARRRFSEALAADDDSVPIPTEVRP
jgi:RNA polymerase sigma-70 factor (ECF subfamily)